LNTLLNFFPLFLNQEAAVGQQLTTVMAFTDPGVGAWTIHVGDGMVTVSQGESADADLVITQSAATFEKSRQGMHDPVEAIQSGQVQVSDFDKLAIFGQLFPM
jgi:putative sterol carrier protein